MSEDLEFLREIIDEFLQDAEALTTAFDDGMIALESDPGDSAALEEMAGALHTLRMQAGFLDFDSLTEVALAMERLLDKLRQESRRLPAELIDLLQHGRQTLTLAMDQLRQYDTSPMELGDLTATMQAAMEGALPEPGESAAVEDASPEAQIAGISTGPTGDEEELPEHGEEEGAAWAEEEVAAAEVPDVEEGPGEPATAAPTPAPAPAADASFEPELEEVEVVEGPISEEVTDFVPDFLTEAAEILDKLDEDLVHLEEAGDDLELLNEIFRAAHTFKGTSAFLGFGQMSDLTHKMENVLDLLRKGEMQLNQGITDVILQGVDQIKILLADIRNNAIVRRDLDDLRRALLIIGETRGASVGAIAPPTAAEPPDATESPGEEPETAATAAPTKPAAPPPPPPPTRQTDQVIRVDVDRIDKIMNLAEELVLGRNRLLQLNAQLLGEHGEDELVTRLNEATSQVGLLTGELQESVMKMRMVPVSRVFSRFPRMVRDLARDLDKQIELVIEDNDTEIDKSVADEIGDPLVHLIRNAVDHGVERPEERTQADKTPRGTVLLSAVHEGNHIVIRIRDDGAGMDPEKLKRKAVEKGILSEIDAERIDDNEAYNLIFAPGFSTAQQVTGVSGRGVGMDVVKTNITRLNGTIELNSFLGEGTEITIRLPLTLAIIGGLQVGVGTEMFIIPLTAVIEALRISTDEIESLHGRRVIMTRGKVLPVIELGQVLGVSDAAENNEVRYVVVVGLAERRMGILVDHLLGQVDVVIKALGEMVGPAHGIAGATILGDGRVCLILDVGELIDMMDRQEQSRGTNPSKAVAMAASPA